MRHHHAASTAAVARINGVALHAAGETLDAEELRQRACTELLRQAAQPPACSTPDDAARSRRRDQRGGQRRHRSAARAASCDVPEPSEEACRRHYAAHQARYRTGERVRVRHILFAVTPGVDVRRAAQARRSRAARRALPRRRRPTASPTRRGQAVQLPERRRGRRPGLARRARTARRSSPASCSADRDRRAAAPGAQPLRPARGRGAGARSRPWRSLRGGARRGGAWRCASRAFVTALRQYLQLLAGAAGVEGVELDSADTPLVQ